MNALGVGGIGADPCMACCCAARLVPTVPLFTVRIRMFGNEEGQCRSLAGISCCQTRVETTFFAKISSNLVSGLQLNFVFSETRNKYFII